MKRKPIDAWLIEDIDNPEYYISSDIKMDGKPFSASVYGTYIYSSRDIANSVSSRCDGRVIPIKIVFKQPNRVTKIRLAICMAKRTKALLKMIIEDILDWIGEGFCT